VGRRTIPERHRRSRTCPLLEGRERSERCFISTAIEGPGGVRFRFVGFWAMTPRGARDSYPQQATELIEQLPHDGMPTVVAGDFNASWRNRHHLRNVASMSALGLVNAYNAFHRIADAVKPDEPTSYYRWNALSPYHMDLVFVPETWSIREVEIGSFEDYPGRRRSDHVPVIVTVNLAMSKSPTVLEPHS